MKRTQKRTNRKTASKAGATRSLKGLRRSLNARPRKLRTTTSSITHPYLACLTGGVSMPPMGVGFPDGNPNKSIVIDFKQVLTLTPHNGGIRFALVSSPYGCIGVQRGLIQNALNIPQFGTTTSLNYSWAAFDNATLFNTTGNAYVVPFQENNSYPVDGESMGAYSTGQYRGLVIAADVSFTGSTMANGGVVTVYKTTPNIVDLTSGTVNTSTVSVKDVTDINAGSTTGTISGRYTGAARVPLSIRSASAKPEYIATWERTVAPEITPLAYTTAGTLSLNFPNPGFDNSVPITVVEYTGLDATASVTIEVRSCLEMVPKVGNMAAFAKPSPPASLAVWERVANFVRALPAATILRAASAGASGYSRAGLAGGLAGMASSLM